MKILTLLICAILVNYGESARILAVFHIPSKSHFIIGKHLLEGLAARGHQVTMASPFPSKESVPNYRDIYIDDVAAHFEETQKKFFETGTRWHIIFNLMNITNVLVDKSIRSSGMQKLIKSDEKFDLVIIEPIMNEAFFGLGQIFNAPVVVVNPGLSTFVNHMTGNVAPFSFVPNLVTTYTDNMSFFERFINTVFGILFRLSINFLSLPMQRKLYEEFFPNAGDFEEARKNLSLALTNTHVLLETPRPYLPNMIPVAGLHVHEPKKLPSEMQSFLEGAKDGAILFSLGSNLQAKHMPEDQRKAVLNTFAKLPQKVLWKFEDENLPGIPKNVKISKWLPQSDILAHPNVKLFITHGGLLSSIETLDRGVPIIGMPFFGDQFTNVANFVNKGYGVRLFFSDLTEETFTQTLQEVLNNPKYEENIKRASKIFKDQPTKPLDRAIFWIEHVLRHKGGTHFRSSAFDISLTQYLLLDVIFFTVILLGTFITGMFLVVKTLCCKSKKEKENGTKSTKNKAKRD